MMNGYDFSYDDQMNDMIHATNDDYNDNDNGNDNDNANDNDKENDNAMLKR